jgi:beta-lactamase superfamily II metal-dependent hydrolase
VGVLTIAGNGAMNDYASAEDVPWVLYADKISKVILKMGVTYVGSNCFSNCIAIEDVVYIGNQNNWYTLCQTAGNNNAFLFAADVSLRGEGYCGENVFWQLSDQGTILTIGGSGSMYNYEDSNDVPWCDSRDTITTVIVENGVTSVGYYALAYCEELVDVCLAESVEILETYAFRQSIKLREISLPEGMNIIGAKAFYDCTSLESVIFPSTLTNIDMRAFGACYGLEELSYRGTSHQWELIDISINENGNLVKEKIIFLQDIPIAAEAFTDVAIENWYNAAVQYMYERGLMEGEDNIFGCETLLSGSEVLNVLYGNSGAPAGYSDSETWAEMLSLVSCSPQTFNQGTLSSLLYRYVLYNTYPKGLWENVNFTEEDACLWAEGQGFWEEIENNCTEWNVESLLTRAQGASVLAAFLQSELANVDRTEIMYSQIKTLINQGGDGKLYIIYPDLCGIETKPGDVLFMLTPNGTTILIDTAAEQAEEKVIGFLRKIDVKDINYLIITHPDADHIGNVQAVAEFICETQKGRIQNYWVNPESSRDNRTETQNYLAGKGTVIDNAVRAGDQLIIDGVTVNVFGPEMSDFQDSVINNHSIVMKFTYGTSTFLTCGDIYADQEKRLMDQYGNQLQADVMKTNHHGSYTSNCVEWIERIDPQIAVTSSNDNGCSVTCRVFGERQILHYSNGLDGMVVIKMDNQRNYEVTSSYDSRLRRNYE